MRKYLSLLLIVLLCLLSVASAEENLIRNGDFSQLDGAGYPEEWSRGMWYTDIGISNLYVDEEGGNNCAVVVNADANDARWEQTVSVEPNTVYCISARVKADNCGSDGYGASISVLETFVYSDQLYDTNDEWKELRLYGKTTDDQDKIVILLRIGGYGNLNTGSACFDDVSCVKVDRVPEGVTVHQLENAMSSGGSSSNVNTKDDEGEPSRNTEMYLLLTALYAVLMLALYRKSYRVSRTGEKSYGKMILIVGMAIAVLLRVVLSVSIRGYNTDINCFTSWSERMYSEGIANFYSESYFCDYPPGYMLILWIPAALRNLLGTGLQSGLHLLFLKCIPVVCDLLGAMLIYRCARRKELNEYIAAGLALIYAFNPAVFIDSAAWGQIDSVFTLFVILCAIKASDENYVASLLSFAVAMLIKPQAMLFAPLGLFAIAINLVRRKNRKKTISFIAGIAAALGLIYATGFIFTVGKAGSIAEALIRPVTWLIELYGGTMGSYAYLTINSLNLYTLFNLNWARMDANTAWSVFAWAMFAVSYIYSMFLYAYSKEKKRILLCGGLLITMIYTFGPMIHERYVYPALLLLMLAYIYDRDKRLLISVTVLTCTAAMNEILVLQGGISAYGNYGHLQSSEQWLNAILSLLNVLNAIFLMLTSADICGVFTGESHISLLKGISGEMIPQQKPSDYRLNLKKREILIIAAVTVVYSIVAFTNLGVTKAPQTSWVSSQSNESVTFDLGKVQEHRMIYYGGICNSTFSVELSNDNEHWTESYFAEYDQGTIFRWIYYVPRDAENTIVYGDNLKSVDGEAEVTFATSEEKYPFQTARYIRITAESAGLTLSEFGFWTRDGELLPVDIVQRTNGLEGFETDPELLIDEQDTVAQTPSYMNSTYFDEIYHARTAYELLHGMSVYEWTHPPLGKVLMMVGVSLFGMTPFGWRFMGTLSGVVMLPLMYLLVKQLTKSRKLSLIAMLLMALDSMHFTQTRLATIDSYSVLWIMLEYFLMFRYVQMDWRTVSQKRSLITLGACGIVMGIACATKWIGIYSGVGLAILFFWKIISEYIGNADMRAVYRKRIFGACLFCILFFVIIPILIYYFSYFRQLRYEGVVTIFDMLKPRWINRVMELQKSMFNYHSGLGGDTHYFRSPWYQWPVIWWPMWYYSGTDYMPKGMISSISCMGNPAVWWFGLFALIVIVIGAAWKRKSPKIWLFTLIGFASQFLPWVLVPRSTFIYHYFASVPFIIICSVLVLEEVRKSSPKLFRISAGVLIGLALVLFVAFYPLESGVPVARSYAMYLRWFKWYNF